MSSHAVESENSAIFLLELLLADPHLVEGVKLANCGATSPAGNLSIGWSQKGDFAIILWEHLLNLLV